jgi:hypothetical protein
MDKGKKYTTGKEMRMINWFIRTSAGNAKKKGIKVMTHEHVLFFFEGTFVFCN